MKPIVSKKKALVTLLTISAMSTVLFACSSDKSSNTTQNSANAPASNASGGSAPAADAAPRKISIALDNDLSKYALQVKDDDKFVKELSKESGYDLNFEFLGHDDEYNQKLTVMFASGDLPDLIRTDSIDSTVHQGAVESGQFTDLTALIDQYGPNLKKNIPPEVWKSPRISKEGKIYAIPVLRPFTGTDILYIRQDWLDKLGMKQPTTIDEYLAYFEAVKKEDMDGNGNPDDEYGLYVRENMDYANLFFPQFSSNPNFWQFKDGQLQPNMIVPDMKESIKFWKMLYDKGYVNPNLFTNKSTDWIAGILQGKAGMWQHELLNFDSTWNAANFVNQPNAKLSFIKSPEGPKGHGLWGANDNIQFAWVIPSKTEHPEDIIKFLDWEWSDKADKFFEFGIPGDTYTENNGKVAWDPASPANTENEASSFYQLVLNPRQDGRMVPAVMDYLPNSDFLKNGIDIAAYEVVKHDDLYMPALKSLENHPELVPGTGAGTLFLDMFAKVVTGKEELDPAFDKFVADWKSRGGDEAIKEATAWYNDFHKN